jgi:subtilase family serine protease
MQGQTVFVAEGDEGAAEFQYDAMTEQCVLGTSRNVNELASDPNVTSIGGTQFKPDYNSAGADVGFVAESVWNEPQFLKDDIGSGGGGASTVWTKSEAPFQATGTPDDGARDVPDISMEAACVTPGAFSVFPGQKTGNNVSCCACGTSLGAPVWAGIAELMVQSNNNQRVGSINTKLYEMGNMQDTDTTGIRDCTLGNNTYNGVTGFDAVAGYDQASGWGTPDVTTFVDAFVGKPTPTPAPTATPIPGKLLATPPTVNFGAVTLNTTSAAKTVKLSNIARATKTLGASPITIVSAIAPAGFNVTNNGCTSPIEPEGSCNIMITFSPSATTPVTAKLTIMDDDPNASTTTVNLRGAGKEPKK